MIDAAQGRQTFPWLPADVMYIGSMAIIILSIQSIISFFRIRLFVEIAEKALSNIRKDTYHKLITLPIDFFANRRVGELNSRLSADLSQIQDTMTTTLAEILRQTISLGFGVVLLVWVSPKLALMNLSILPVIIVAALIFGRFIRNLSKQSQDQLADSNSIVQETLLGISNVKAFVNEYYEANRYGQKLNKAVSLAVRGYLPRHLCLLYYFLHLRCSYFSDLVWRVPSLQRRNIRGRLNDLHPILHVCGRLYGQFPRALCQHSTLAGCQ